MRDDFIERAVMKFQFSFPEIIRKLYLKLFYPWEYSYQSGKSLQWCREQAEDFTDWAQGRNPELLLETKLFSQKTREDWEKLKPSLPSGIGGGGFYALLYFITRLRKPLTVFETGVALGFSSRAFLEAISRNGQGRLFSSDFPYLRIKNPVKYIGLMVPENLRKYWELYLKGDRKNLQGMVSGNPFIDLIHYDSDKSYSGRKWALSFLKKYFRTETILIMDDIQDNSFFMDYVQKNKYLFRVFHFEGKYCGLASLIDL